MMEETLVCKNDPAAASQSLMKAVAITAPKSMTMMNVPIPNPRIGEVRIHLEGCGVCASNIPIWEGRDWFDYPQEPGCPGHEGWGVIDAIGPDVIGVKKGDRVACLSYKAFAEYDIAKANDVVVLPASLKDKPFPGEALGCAMNIFNRSDIQAGQTVSVIGTGFLGILLIQLLKSAGANVIAISQRAFSLQSATSAGADETILMQNHQEIIDKVKQLTSGKFCHRVIEVTGKEWPLNLGIELTGVKGKLIVAGFHQDGMRQVNVQLLNWRGIDMISAHERDSRQYIHGMNQAIEAIDNGTINPFPLFTHIFNLNKAADAFKALIERPEGFIKAILVNK